MKALKWTAGALLLLMACTGNKGVAAQAEAAGDSAVATVSDTLVFEEVELIDSLAYKVKVVDYSGDEEPYPYTIETVTEYYKLSTLEAVAGKPEVVKFINQYLTISAAGEYMEEPVTAENVAKRYAQLKKDGIDDVRSAFKRASGASLGENAGSYEEGEDGMMEMGFASANEWEHNVYFHWQTPTLLTLWKSGYDYAAGAVHGMPWNFGLTFDLKNLRMLSYDDILKKEGREAVLKMVIAELQDEYGEDGMLNSPEDIGLPDNDPALEAEGVRFDYGAYEIGPYALGMPSVVIPYEKMKPYLTEEVKELLGF
ncbi:MAG: DUF3298 domain-containing protein [Bacteroidaceae bacterium]|nr:DUF3298 domain-containing protein [Bacteroidaceae bacterium]